jgi:starvation-inducible DNA-binding protein
MVTENTQSIINGLNRLLATYQVYYQNLRGFHWNIQGPRFFDLHAKFEELYNESAVNIDDIAERILALQGQPLHSFQHYLENSKIEAKTEVHDGETSVKTIIENLNAILEVELEILKEAANIDDEGTVTLISDMIKIQEKTRWMFRAWLK